jgi:WD40 repeat protein
MMKDEHAHLQLFDLIAREWTVPSPVQQIVFNSSDTAVAFACADGGIFLAATADKSSPNQRIRRAVDTARLTIAPRDKPYLPLKAAELTAGRTSGVVAHGAQNFAFAKENGRINTLTPGGTAVHLAPRAGAAIPAIAASPDGETIAYACGNSVHIHHAESDTPQTLSAADTVTALAFSPDGRTLAVAHQSGVSRWAMAAPDQGPLTTPLPAIPVGLDWQQDGGRLACRMVTDGFCLIDVPTNTARAYGGFPAPVRSTAFSAASGTVVASGAFRVAAWSLADNRDVITGKAGLVLIDAIAACPTRNLVAVGYANGLLSLAEIGRPSEVLLREDTGAGITAMAWSRNGRYLALAGTDGSTALVEFPDSMFKS